MTSTDNLILKAQAAEMAYHQRRIETISNICMNLKAPVGIEGIDYVWRVWYTPMSLNQPYRCILQVNSRQQAIIEVVTSMKSCLSAWLQAYSNIAPPPLSHYDLYKEWYIDTCARRELHSQSEKLNVAGA